MRGRYQVVRILHGVPGRKPHRRGFCEVALQVVGEGEVVADVRLQRGERDALSVWLAVGLDLIGLAGDQRLRTLEVGDRLIELTHGDVPVTAMPQESGVGGEALHAVGKDPDCLTVPAEIRGAPADPDEGRRIRRRLAERPRARP